MIAVSSSFDCACLFEIQLLVDWSCWGLLSSSVDGCDSVRRSPTGREGTLIWRCPRVLVRWRGLHPGLFSYRPSGTFAYLSVRDDFLLQGFQVEDEAVFYVGVDYAGPGFFELVEACHFNIADDVEFAAEVEHFLGLADSADR